MDDVIFEEFKGTGNMELKLDRTLQERRVFPAIDITKSGTRREDKLLPDDEMKASWSIRRTVSNDGYDAYQNVLRIMRSTKTNREFIDTVNKD